MADLGLDAKTLAANIIGGPGFRRRVNAWAEATFGEDSPFGTAAFTDSGTVAGNVVVTDEQGVIPVAVLPAADGPEGIRGLEITQKVGNPERFLKAGSLRFTVRAENGILKVGLDFEQVAAEWAGTPVDTGATRLLEGVDRSVEVRIDEDFDDEVFTSPGGATLTAASSAPAIAPVEVLGPTRLPDGMDRWVLQHHGASAGSTSGVVRASWPGVGGVDQVDHYGVRVLARSGDPLPGLAITGLQASPALRVGSVVRDDFEVSPVDAVVSLASVPDELVAQGVLSGSAFDGQGRGSVTWAGVGPGYTDALVRAARREDPSDYVEQLVTLWVEGSGPRGRGGDGPF